MKQAHRIGTPYGATLIPEVSVMDGLAPLNRRIHEERRHPTLPPRRVTFGELLTQVLIGRAPTNIGTVRRVLPS
jgi:hypothetical protein